MSPVTAIAMYFVIWWTVLFAVLPIGTKPVAQADQDSGWRGAPERPAILRKALITTIVAAVVWLLCWFLITSPWLSFRDGLLALPNN
jgi:predicted secreted protein